MSQQQQKKQRFAHQATQIVKRLKDFYNSKESIYLTLLSAVMVFMPFAHLFYYGSSDLKGDFFGFRWMSSFLFALALPSFMLSTGLMIGYFSRKYKEDFFKLLSAMITFSGCFYMVWTFWTTPDEFKDISLTWYLLVLFGLTIGFFFLIRLIEKYVSKAEEKLKIKIQKLTKGIQILVRFATRQRFKAKDLREYEVDYKEVLTELDNATD